MGRAIRAALVSTNSITQGDSVATLWKPLFAEGVHIDFAHRTFRWDSESSKKAAVHCVIVGFSTVPNDKPKNLYSGEQSYEAKIINAYLVDAPAVFIESRKKPLCKVPEIIFGNMPNDDGLLSQYTTEEKDAICAQYPLTNEMFKPFVGAKEFINGTNRWCLWLKEISAQNIRKVPPVMDAIKKVRELRLKSTRTMTQKKADTPALFGEIRQPNGNYLIVPRHSSENRRYIPLGYMNKDYICGDSNFMIPDISLYHFGVLTSNVHNAWMRTVCGRIKSDYRYSKDIVYNNFPWPSPTDAQRKVIEQTAQTILDARAKFPDSSLADLYDETTMPPELRKAHQANDRAVMAAYGFDTKISEAECVAKLMDMYQKLTKK
ncbi:MAG: class I SAM-dependent DNA methyltransferase [Schwartzia sp.]|nr:class I SAM-dependent DNA methyltransferase [Schwartzia sp. (in: firmicutes)]